MSAEDEIGKALAGGRITEEQAQALREVARFIRTDPDWIRRYQEEDLLRVGERLDRYEQFAAALAALALDGPSPAAAHHVEEAALVAGVPSRDKRDLARHAVQMANHHRSRSEIVAILTHALAITDPAGGPE